MTNNYLPPPTSHARNYRHGHAVGNGSAEYITWQNMRARCNNPKDASYSRYGGRGIRVCKRWDESFTAFIDDMGWKPSPVYTIDRIDNDGDYEPGNCCWATPKEQANNRRSSTFLALDGVSMTIAQWSERTGLKPSAICQRLAYGWSVERTLTEPKRGSR